MKKPENLSLIFGEKFRTFYYMRQILKNRKNIVRFYYIAISGFRAYNKTEKVFQKFLLHLEISVTT